MPHMDKTVRSAEADQKNYMRREEYTKKTSVSYLYIDLFICQIVCGLNFSVFKLSKYLNKAINNIYVVIVHCIV